MTVYVGDLRQWHNRHRKWCHMMTDQDDLTELHEMARKIGLMGEWFQDHPDHPHYDLVESKRERAINLGAIPVSDVDLVMKCSRLMREKYG